MTDSAILDIVTLNDVKFFDDHFQAGWILDSGSANTDALSDQMIISGGTSDPGVVRHSLPNILATVNTKIMWQVDQIDGGGTYKIEAKHGSTWEEIVSGATGKGRVFAYLPEGYTYTEIRLTEEVNGATKKVYFDFVAIFEGTTGDPADYMADDPLVVTNRGFRRGINQASFTVSNFTKHWNALLEIGDYILIYCKRGSLSGETCADKLFGGRIVVTDSVCPQPKGYKWKIECEGHAQELMAPPELANKGYLATNGRTILEYLIGLGDYVYWSADPHHWFDNGGAYGSTDDRVDSTHDLAIMEKTPFKAIQDLLPQMDNPSGVIGFDIVEMPSGALHGFLRNSQDWASPLSLSAPETYSRKRDLHPTRNKQKVYGAWGRLEPSSGDACESSLDLWSMIAGMGTGIELNGTWHKVGSYSVRCYGTGLHYERGIRWTLPQITKIKQGTVLSFWAVAGGTAALDLKNIRIETDDSNYFQADLPDLCSAEKQYKFDLGPQNEYSADKNPDGKWTKTGNPSWDIIRSIRFYGKDNDYMNWALFIDGLNLYPVRFYYTAEDATSQSVYNVRCGEPIEEEGLQSDTACEARAKAEIQVLKNPIISYDAIRTEGRADIYAAMRQRIIFSNDDVDEYVPIETVRHQVKAGVWETFLELNAERQSESLALKILSKLPTRLNQKF